MYGYISNDRKKTILAALNNNAPSTFFGNAVKINGSTEIL